MTSSFTRVLQVSGAETTCRVTSQEDLSLQCVFYRADSSQQQVLQVSPAETRVALADADLFQLVDGKEVPARELSSDDLPQLMRYLKPQLDLLFPVSSTSSRSRDKEETAPANMLMPSVPGRKSSLTATNVSREQSLDEVLQMQSSKKHMAAGDHVAAVTGFKRTVTLIRKRERSKRQSSRREASCDNEPGAGGLSLLPETYYLMGRSFEALKKTSRAESCYVLACKCSSSADQAYAVQAKGRLVELKKRKLGKEAPSAQVLNTVEDLTLSDQTSSSGVYEIAVRDMEDILSNHTMYPLYPQATSTSSQTNSESDLFQFACTMCGECCRSADNLLLSPHDIYEMTRSAGLKIQGISSTSKLLAHPRFKGVFHYTQRGGVAPVCFLRPVQQLESSGHCFFAYPLYSREVVPDAEIFKTSESAVPKKALYRVTDEVDEHSAHDGNSEKRELVPFSDYYAALSSSQGPEHDEQRSEYRREDLVEDIEENSYNTQAQDLQEEMKELSQLPGDWEAVSNSFGRQALGCMLGIQSMPQMCRSYPVAPELSQADFWHVRTSFWRQSNNEIGGSANTMQNTSSLLAAGWQAEENYVVVKTSGCEGFATENIKNEGFLRKTPVRDGHYVNDDSVEEEENFPRLSMSNFLGTETLDRLEETQWLLALIDDISNAFCAKSRLTSSGQDIFTVHPFGRGIRLLYMNRLAQIWYNFDSLSCFRARPIRSYRRLKNDIQTLSWILVNETIQFLVKLNEGTTTGTSEEVSAEYSALLTRLNVV